MNAATLFVALSQAIFNSLAQGLIIFTLIRLILFFSKELSSNWKYKLLYCSMVIISAGFITSFLGVYLSAHEVIIYVAKGEIPVTSPVNSIKSFSSLTAPYSFWIALSYITGLALHTFLLLIGFYRLKASKLRGHTPAHGFWGIRLQSLKNKLGISREVTLYFSDKILVPFTAGFLKPVILLPIAIVNQLTPDQVETILLHELAHIRRNDYLMNLLQRVMEALLFFNPMVWLISKEIKSVREYCCDELVLQHTDKASSYARALAIIEEYRITTGTLVMSLSGHKKHNLLTRIIKITSMETHISNQKQKMFALAGVIAISLSLAWVLPADTTKTKKSHDTLKVFDTLKVEAQKPHKIVPPIPPAPPAPSEAPVPSFEVPPPPPEPAFPEFPIPPAPADTNELKKHFNSPEWKKQMENMKIEAEKMKKQFDSPEWKKQMENMKVEAEKMKKQFDSPEWKKQMENMKIEAEKMKKQFDSPEWKKQMADMKIEAEKMKKQFDSPEWKKQMEDMKIETEKMKKQFDSPEWKKQMEDMKIETEKMKKQFDSPEWKKQIEEMKIETEKLKKELDSPEFRKKVQEQELKEKSQIKN
ncbi:M48 family metalloprotease [Flavihumibacter sp. R14]|nr:M48 family metalloprotease [Flavihumibacter soli]